MSYSNEIFYTISHATEKLFLYKYKKKLHFLVGAK